MNRTYGNWGWSYAAAGARGGYGATVSSPTVSVSRSTMSVMPVLSAASVVSSPTVAALVSSPVSSSALSSSIVQQQGSGNVPTTSSYPSSSSSYYPSSSGYDPNARYEAAGGEDDAVYVGEGDDNGPGMYSEEPSDGSGSRRTRKARRRGHRKGYPASSARRRRAAMLAKRMRGQQMQSYDDDDYSGFGKALANPYTDKPGAGGYVYRQYANGDIYILTSPAGITIPTRYLPKGSGSVWTAITRQIGPYGTSAGGYKAASQIPSSIVVTGKKNQWIDNLFSAIGQGSSADGKKLVAQAAIQHGPEVAESLSAFVEEKKSSPAAIQKKIDRLKTKLAAAKAKHDTVKVKKLQARIKGLQARLLQAQSDAAGVVDSTMMVQPSSFPWKYVVGGVVGLVLIGILAKQFMK